MHRCRDCDDTFSCSYCFDQCWRRGARNLLNAGLVEYCPECAHGREREDHICIECGLHFFCNTCWDETSDECRANRCFRHRLDPLRRAEIQRLAMERQACPTPCGCNVCSHAVPRGLPMEDWDPPEDDLEDDDDDIGY